LKKSYIQINFIFAGIIACIMLYSGIFSPENANHPLPCFISLFTGHTCPGCGLSRSFSAMIRGQFTSAAGYNLNGPKIFSFFFIQFFLRLFINLLLRKRVSVPFWIGIADIAISLLLFFWAFWGLMFWNF
jgi:hypothetical protein